MTAADRHLLFGLLALQDGLIDQGVLVAAFQAWTRDKARSLADQLVARVDLDADSRAGLEPVSPARPTVTRSVPRQIGRTVFIADRHHGPQLADV